QKKIFTEISNEIKEEISYQIQKNFEESLDKIFKRISNKNENFNKVDDKNSIQIQEIVDNSNQIQEIIDKYFYEIYEVKRICEIDDKQEISNEQEEQNENFTELFDEIQKEILIQIQERIKEHFYKIFDEIYKDIKQKEVQEIFNVEQKKNFMKISEIKKEISDQIKSDFKEYYSNNKILNEMQATFNKEQKIFSSIITCEIDRIKKIFSETMKKHFEIKEKLDKPNLQMDLFIIFIIFDSGSLLFLTKIAKYYIKNMAEKIAKKGETDNVEKNIQKFILFRVLVEIICKNIPLIVIMAIYTSSIVIYTLIPFIALTTSCFKCFLNLILLFKRACTNENKKHQQAS
ncbi:hypothetical protein C2G38_2075068, partial [Gigaspora rosea]